MKQGKDIDLVLPKRLETKLIHLLVSNAYLYGDLSEEDLNKGPKYVLAKILESLDNVSDDDFQFSTDYRDSLLKNAGIMARAGDFEFAIILYATFFEHSLNKIIDHYCTVAKLTHTEQKEIIRNVSIVGKTTWLLSLLKLPSINKKYLNIIQELADRRNAFVHYKWIPKSERNLAKEEEERANFLEKIKSAIAYIKGYESRVIFKRGKAKLKKHLKQFVRPY